MVLDVQCLLPPIAPLVGRGIHHLVDASDVKLLHCGVVAIDREVRDLEDGSQPHRLAQSNSSQTYPSLIRIPRRRPMRNILLQRNRNLIAHHTLTRSIIERIRHILPMQRRRDRKIIRIRIIPVRLVQVARVACEHELGAERGGARDLVGVVLRLAAVEDGRVEGLGDIVADGGPGVESGEGVGEVLFQRGVVLDEGRGEEEALWSVAVR